MSHLDVLKTVKLPVRAVGSVILNADDETVATTSDSVMACALATLINYGEAKAETDNEIYATQEAAKSRMFGASLANGKPSYTKPKSPWSY